MKDLKINVKEGIDSIKRQDQKIRSVRESPRNSAQMLNSVSK